MSIRAKDGFTLIEVVVTVGVIGILAALATPNFLRYRKEAQMKTCIGNLKTIQSAYEQARLSGAGFALADSGGNMSISGLIGEDRYIKKHLWCPCDKAVLDEDAYEIGEDELPLCVALGSDEEYPHRLMTAQ